jgi:hypothetical protein
MSRNSEELRKEFVHWLSSSPWHFFVTLNLNRFSTPATARTHFKRLCQRIDRKVLGPQYYKRNHDRTLIIALPEHIHSNYHLHCLVLFRCRYKVKPRKATDLFLSSWKEVILSGTAMVQDIPAKYTLAEYVTKELPKQGRYELVILSSEFWPR